ncbi:MAG: VanZ family protein, partial [Nocardioides sp.]
VSDQAINALIAVALGSVAAVLLFVPTAAYQYRLDGSLAPRDLAVLLSGAVYALALWTYTLLPFPASDDYRCKGRNLDLLNSIRAIGGGGEGVGGLLRDPAFLQIALNVLLFVPLGVLVRMILKRGVLVATGLGLAISLLIEVTQLTGVWNLYDCAYRLFDVDDLIVNTLGAFVGSALSAIFVRRRRADRPALPTTITSGRRLVGMLSDVLFLVIAGATVAIGYRAFCVYGPATYDSEWQNVLQLAIPYAVEVALVLGAGRTVGELTISVRAVTRRRRWTYPARLIKLLVGITPIFALLAAGDRWTLTALPLFAVVTVVVAMRTREHRGLSHVLAGMDLRIEADEAFDR